MHLVYIDEVKYDPPTQPFHWLCALAFPEAAIQPIDLALADLARQFFGTSLVSKESEFHGKDILQGKGPYKGRGLRDRVDLYKSLLDIVDLRDDLGRIEIRIDPARMVTQDYKDMAFMFLVEKVDGYMRQCDSTALLIADEDRELATTNVASLSAYKAAGTQHAFGRAIRRIVDTIHHTKSHESRLLQLADIYVYTLAMMSGDCSRHPRSELSAHARTKRNLRFPSKYKNWPTDGSWYAPSST